MKEKDKSLDLIWQTSFKLIFFSAVYMLLFWLQVNSAYNETVKEKKKKRPKKWVREKKSDLNFKLINRRKQKQSNGMTIKKKCLSAIRAPVYSRKKQKKTK